MRGSDFAPRTTIAGFDFVATESASAWRRRDSCARRRFAPGLAGETVELDAGAAHHATRVLRLAVGDALTLFDGTGGEYAATLVRVDKRGASVRVERFVPVERESPLALTLAQGIVASDAMDSAIRKATELGVTAIQPLVTARSAPMPDGERGEKRVAHWRQIAIAAAEQSGRNRIAGDRRAASRSPTGCRHGGAPASCCCRTRNRASPPSRGPRRRSPS